MVLAKKINAIIFRSSAGTLADFESLYQEYQGLVRATLYKLCSPGDLDDLVQEAFVKIWNGLPKFKEGAKLTTWIYRIAYNVAVDHLRRKKPTASELKLVHGMTSTSQQIENRDLVLKSLQELSIEHRSVIVLNTIEGLSIFEVAQVLGIP